MSESRFDKNANIQTRNLSGNKDPLSIDSRPGNPSFNGTRSREPFFSGSSSESTVLLHTKFLSARLGALSEMVIPNGLMPSMPREEVINRLRYYEGIVNEAGTIIMSKDDPITLDIFRLGSNESSEEFSNRIRENMIGKRFSLGDGSLYEITNIGGSGGSSYGFIADKLIEDSVTGRYKVPEISTEKVFIKVIYPNKGDFNSDPQLIDLKRHQNVWEIGIMMDLHRQGFENSPEIKGVLPFGIDYSRSSDNNNVFYEPILRQYDPENKNEPPTYFINKSKKVGDQSEYLLKIPECMMVVMSFSANGRNLSHTVHKRVNAEKVGAPMNRTFDRFVKIENVLARGVIAVFNEEYYKKIVERIKVSYRQNDSFNKFSDIVSDFLMILSFLPNVDGQAVRNDILKELNVIYEYLDEEIRVTNPIVSNASDKLINVLDNLHNTGFAHRDVKLTNVLLKKIESGSFSEDDFIIIDYGLTERIVEPVLDKEILKDTIFQEIRHSFEGFLSGVGVENSDVTGFGEKLNDFLRKQKQGSDPMALFKEMERLCSEFSPNVPNFKLILSNFIKSHLYVKKGALHGSIEDKRVNFFSGYDYLLRNEIHSAWLSTANEQSYMGRGTFLGTPHKTYPPQLFSFSSNFVIESAHINDRMESFINTTDTLLASRYIKIQDLPILINYYENISQNDDALKARAEFLREIIEKDPKKFDSLELEAHEHIYLKRFFYRKYSELRTKIKYTVMPQVAVDDFSTILTILDLRGNVSFGLPDGYPNLLQQSVLPYSDTWVPFIRNLFLGMKNLDGTDFFTPKMNDLLDVDLFMKGSLNEEMLAVNKRPSVRDVFEDQKKYDQSKKGHDWSFHYEQLLCLSSSLRSFYEKIDSYNQALSKLHADILSGESVNNPDVQHRNAQREKMNRFNDAFRNKRKYFEDAKELFSREINSRWESLRQGFLESRKGFEEPR